MCAGREPVSCRLGQLSPTRTVPSSAGQPRKACPSFADSPPRTPVVRSVISALERLLVRLSGLCFVYPSRDDRPGTSGGAQPVPAPSPAASGRSSGVATRSVQSAHAISRRDHEQTSVSVRIVLFCVRDFMCRSTRAFAFLVRVTAVKRSTPTAMKNIIQKESHL